MANAGFSRIFSFLLRKSRTIIWLSGLAALLFVCLLSFSAFSPFERFQVQVFDTYQRLSPRLYGETPVVVVDIDEESLAKVGQWPWPRSTIAEFTDRLGELGAAAIVFDIVFSEPDRTSPARALNRLKDAGVTLAGELDASKLDNDVVLGEAIGRNPTVMGLLLSPTVSGTPPAPKAGVSFGGADPASYLPLSGGAVRNLPVLDEPAAGVGVLNFRPQLDGIVRRVPMIANADGKLFPSLSLEALRVAQGASTFLIRGTGASGEADTGAPAMTAIKAGNFTIPTNADGSIWVYYTDREKPPTIPAYQLLDPALSDQLSDQVAGHIILIGTSAQLLLDLRATPMSASVAGVNIHAEIIDQILSGVSISRPDWAEGMELFAAIILSLLVILPIPFFTVAANVLWAILLVSLVVFTGWWAFTDLQMLLDPVFVSVSVLASLGVGSTVRLLVSENEERFVREAFGRYLAPSLVNQLARNPGELVLGGEDRELTLLFCDIRGFTNLSEGLNPTELTELLNNFLTPMTDVLLQHGATIDKYMGDAIMAFWNAPIDQEGHAESACHAVLEMQAALARLNAGHSREIKIGIGLNTGECCVGNLGSTQRFNYSAIGDAVNVAARIEALTKQYGIVNLVAETTAAGADDLAKLEIDRVRVVGRTEPISIFTLVGDNIHKQSAGFVELEAAHHRMLSAYHSGELETARQCLSDVKEIAPDNLHALYSVYSRRIEDLQANGVPENWDGVFVAREK